LVLHEFTEINVYERELGEEGETIGKGDEREE
jgi:hypothetical protein